MDEGVLDRADFEARNRSVVERYRAGTIGPAEFCAFYASTLAGPHAAGLGPAARALRATRVLPRLGDAARALVARHRDAGERLRADHRDQPLPHRADRRRPRLRRRRADRHRTRGGGRRLHRRQCRHPQHARGQGGAAAAWLEAAGTAGRGAIAAATFYSDSANDLPLLRAVGRAVAVDPDPRCAARPQERGWTSPRPAALGRGRLGPSGRWRRRPRRAASGRARPRPRAGRGARPVPRPAPASLPRPAGSRPSGWPAPRLRAACRGRSRA